MKTSVCKYKNISVEELQKLFNESISFNEVMRKLGYSANRGKSYIGLKKYVQENNINFEHFKGKAHGTANTAKYELNDILVRDSKYCNQTSLKKRILRNNLLEYKCYCCGITEWLNKPIVLQLHHINGNNRDNRIENLQLLYPNCHSQTDSFCGKIIDKQEQPKENTIKVDNSKIIPKDKLIELLSLYSFVEIGRLYNVSDNAVRRWCKKYNLPYKRRDVTIYLNENGIEDKRRKWML